MTIINEVMDYFQKNGTDPGGWWAFTDDYSSLNLEFNSSSDDTAFWIDIRRDGTIRVIWRPAGGEIKSLTFVPHRETVTIYVPDGYKDAEEFLRDCQFEASV